MLTPEIDSLVRFCAAQRCSFDRKAWLAYGCNCPSLVARVALYLSMTSWYGHDSDLADIARKVEGDSPDAPSAEADAIDLAEISARVRFIGVRCSCHAGGDRPVAASWQHAPFGREGRVGPRLRHDDGHRMQ